MWASKSTSLQQPIHSGLARNRRDYQSILLRSVDDHGFLEVFKKNLCCSARLGLNQHTVRSSVGIRVLCCLVSQGAQAGEALSQITADFVKVPVLTYCWWVQGKGRHQPGRHGGPERGSSEASCDCGNPCGGLAAHADC